ncbi:MAG: UPF0149 family protein [Reichenbachiella sp.]
MTNKKETTHQNDVEHYDLDLDFLQEILDTYGKESLLRDVSALDGFFTAIVSGPTIVMPAEWMPTIWGGDGSNPEWKSEEEMRRFMNAVMMLMNSIADGLIHTPDEYEPLFGQTKEGKVSLLGTTPWCMGYMLGVNLGNWDELPEELDFNLRTISTVAGGTLLNEDGGCTLDSDKEDIFIRSVAEGARDLHGYWLDHRQSEKVPVEKPIVREESKVGRNDPCPCGSGKKFKKCCG